VQDAIRKCANCDGVIGRLETAPSWQGHDVCATCYERLAAKGERAPVEERPAPFSGSRSEHAGEEVIWEGTSSQIANLRAFMICALSVLAIAVAAVMVNRRVDAAWVTLLVAVVVVVPVAIACRKWLEVRFKKYTLTTERLRVVTGIFSKRIEELELYRVKDTTYLQPFFLRLFNLGHIVLTTSDRSSPMIIVEAVPEVRERREQIRRCVEARRDAKRVREVDFQ